MEKTDEKLNEKCLKLTYSIGNNEFVFYDINEFKTKLSEIYDSESRVAYQNISINLIETDFDNSFSKKILWIDGLFFDVDFMINNKIHPFEVYDSIDGDTFELYETFYDDFDLKEEYNSLFSSNIFYLDRIYVNKEYRNKGYAKTVLKKLDEILIYILKLNVGLITIYSQPFEIKNDKIDNVYDEKISKELDSLYEKCNYRSVKNTKFYYKIIE